MFHLFLLCLQGLCLCIKTESIDCTSSVVDVACTNDSKFRDFLLSKFIEILFITALRARAITLSLVISIFYEALTLKLNVPYLQRLSSCYIIFRT